jgi:ornithine carbamoyltransferase
MTPSPRPVELHTVNAIPPDELAALVDRARSLQIAAEAGSAQPLLRGRKYGLLRGCAELAGDDEALFDRAAVELGAQVAHIRPDLTERSAARDVQQTAQLLGRLYDALICEGMAPAVVRQLRVDAGVPVFDRIMSPSHLVARAAEMLGPNSRLKDNRRFVLQALLLRAGA